MTRVTRLLVIVASSNCWNRFFPSKSYGVEAPILLGSESVAWNACLAGVFRICFFPRLTIWVTSLGFCAAELLPPHLRFYPMFSGVTKWSTSAQPSRIRSHVHNSGDTGFCIVLQRGTHNLSTQDNGAIRFHFRLKPIKHTKIRQHHQLMPHLFLQRLHTAHITDCWRLQLGFIALGSTGIHRETEQHERKKTN